jgi:hypothetical protein
LEGLSHTTPVVKVISTILHKFNSVCQVGSSLGAVIHDGELTGIVQALDRKSSLDRVIVSSNVEATFGDNKVVVRALVLDSLLHFESVRVSVKLV